MIVDGFFDWAIREPGPPNRRVSNDNNLSVIIAHSLEGNRGSYSAMFDPNRFPTAWHGTVALDGKLYQHYPVEAGLAASGPGNPYGPAFESEGMAPSELTIPQVGCWLLVIREMEEYTGRMYRRGTHRQGLTEHRDWAATACPGQRYAPLYAALEEDDMTPAQEEEMAALRARRELAELVADLNSYEEVKKLYAYAKLEGMIP